MITPEQREQVRLSVLRHLDANTTDFGLSSALLLQFLKNDGQRVDAMDLKIELRYLADKNLIARIAKVISPENAHWRITAEGRDFFAQQ